MCRGKAFLLTAVILVMASVANAGLVLTVNGLDTSIPIKELRINKLSNY